MEKDRKIKVIMLSAVIIAVIGLSIAFAALSRVLNITGTSTMDKAGWDIHFKNVQFVNKTPTASVSGTPSPTSNNTSISITGLSVTLKQPGDYVTYSADIENSGDIDAEIALVTPPNLDNELFEFDVVYTGTNNHPTVGDELSHTSPNNVKNITMTFRYKSTVTSSQLPKTAQTVPITYSIQYVQSFKTTTTEQASSQTYSVGDKFCLNGDKECFYTISDNGDTVTALAEWNLNIGDNKNPNVTEGLQDESVRGFESDGTTYGNIFFSSTNYWYDSTNKVLKSEYGNSYPAFVFDSNSSLWQPLQNYQTYLRNTLGKTSVSATLMSYEQAVSLGCSPSNNSCKNSPATAPSWVYQTTYWLGSARSNSDVWYVYSRAGFYSSFYGNNSNYGLRPVITISKSDI